MIQGTKRTPAVARRGEKGEKKKKEVKLCSLFGRDYI